MSLLEFYSSLIEMGWVSLYMGLVPLLIIVIFMEYTNLGKYAQIFWTLILWILSPTILWLFGLVI